MEFRIEWLCRDRKLSVDGHRFSTAKVGAATMRINLILTILKRANMCITKCIAASVFTSKSMTVMAKIRI